MEVQQETLLCNRNIFVFCKIFNYDYVNDCDKELEIFEMTLYRPVLFLICILAMLLGLSSVWNTLTKYNKHMKGKIEYTILHVFSVLWFALLLFDRCVMYYINQSGTIVILAEICMKIMLMFSFLNCSLIDIFNNSCRKLKNWQKTICVYIVALISIVFILVSYLTSLLFFEIVYLLTIYIPLASAIIIFFVSIIKYTREKILLLILLCSNVFLFGFGLVLYLAFNQDMCDVLSPYFASEEIFALTTVLSLWMFCRFSKKLKETVLDGKVIGKMEYEGEKYDIELELL